MESLTNEKKIEALAAKLVGSSANESSQLSVTHPNGPHPSELDRHLSASQPVSQPDSRIAVSVCSVWLSAATVLL